MTDYEKNQVNKTVLIMAGGTGGHIFPALATAQVLQDKGVHIEWLGTKKGLEARLVPEHHYSINYIEIGGLRGKGIKTLLLLPFKLVRAMFQTLGIYHKVKPDVILGMGGFVTGPGGIVGWLLRKPLVLHEQNAIAGLTNKLLFKFAKKVYAAFPGAFTETSKLMIIGNPVRKEITQLKSPEQRFKEKWAEDSGKQLNILVIGGSLGATALNEKLPKTLAIIAQNKKLQESEFDKICVRHQCGEKHIEMTKDNYKWLDKFESDANIDVDIMPFINDMAKNYEWADLVICRSGALTVSEIAAVGVTSLLVPFPYAVDDHQSANAAYLANQEAAFLIQQNELSSDKLADLLVSLNQEKLLTMAVKARQLSINNAAEVVADECLQLAG
ncbi:MAG: undecaprenyldiphospho-muramoylpentapeptide beta-N-acetylglucosaminyltransferase [gamma proteobacterium symbiont of Bathyaustriella thionipta]|nr:undecaprenyldiphospho-muramoylpentapeptide beta-N-acetylglucosaminyltransferase [gamma proteobacterium symbiont of Bathyaustriella thionipta]MCU7949313.1 undecaprenyldiphospho-muramoylpentapeptide beta-N-acetylglucosaminyltransferase [gamma proteobacterium symbiont of Bathyaustriella thionipta]MCU7953383.1 undecaprenyldiphospho-muramoylpentapeptide beta-N-acetylglucosaminyltransferase [gamma proteobacterium symbiont of Bathyaustriella thionipta]MCU7955902.1 undecaprenyldiphospho-muramoylpenta